MTFEVLTTMESSRTLTAAPHLRWVFGISGLSTPWLSHAGGAVYRPAHRTGMRGMGKKLGLPLIIERVKTVREVIDSHFRYMLFCSDLVAGLFPLETHSLSSPSVYRQLPRIFWQQFSATPDSIPVVFENGRRDPVAHQHSWK